MSKFVIRAVPTGVKFDLCAANGQVIAGSEVYSARAACLRGIESVRRCARLGRVADLTEEGGEEPANPKFELYQDKRGAFRFRLRARNGQIIVVSEPYSGKGACQGGIDSVIANAPAATIE